MPDYDFSRLSTRSFEHLVQTIALRTIGYGLTIFGDGPEREATRRQIERLGLQDVVSLPGFVATEAVDDAIARATCLLQVAR